MGVPPGPGDEDADISGVGDCSTYHRKETENQKVGGIVTKSRLVPLAPWHANKSRDKVLGQGKWLYLESHTKKTVDLCPKAPS